MQPNEAEQPDVIYNNRENPTCIYRNFELKKPIAVGESKTILMQHQLLQKSASTGVAPSGGH